MGTTSITVCSFVSDMNMEARTMKFSQLRSYEDMKGIPALKDVFDFMLLYRHQGKSADMVNQFWNFNLMMEAGYQCTTNRHRCGLGILYVDAQGNDCVGMLDGQHRCLLKDKMLEGWRKVHGDETVVDRNNSKCSHYSPSWFHDGKTFDLSKLDFPTNIISAENVVNNKVDLAKYLQSKYAYLRDILESFFGSFAIGYCFDLLVIF